MHYELQVATRPQTGVTDYEMAKRVACRKKSIMEISADDNKSLFSMCGEFCAVKR